MSAWGALGTTVSLEGASGRSWKIRFERRLAPRESSAIANPASSVWLVRDEASSRLYAAKRQALASLDEVDALVDEAAAWRAAFLADENHQIVVELTDVFVDRSPPFSVTFLAEFCTRGLIPKQNLSEPVLLTIVADLSTACAALPSPHAHIAYDSLLIDEKGLVRLAGFGAHRSAILRDNPGLTPNDDSFDIGLLLYELIFGKPPPEDLSIPESSPYSSAVLNLIQLSFTHPHPNELCEAAISAGAILRAPIVNPDKSKTSDADDVSAPTHVLRSVERNVDRLVEGVDIGPTFANLLSNLSADPEAVASSIFKALFKKPMSQDPLCAVRAFTMLHNLMLDGPEAMLSIVRAKDKFMQWAESSWDQETVQNKLDQQDAHQALQYFSHGELSFYAALLRRKARFHQLAANGFSGRWDRTGAVNPDGRSVLESRRRKVINGMADLSEMISELGCLFASASDPEAPAKHAGLGAMVSDCCLAYNGALELAQEVQSVRDAEKLAPGIERLYKAARALVFAVEHVPSAGGEPWVSQFANEIAPDLVSEFLIREKGDANFDENRGSEFPSEGWENVQIETKKIDDTGKKKKKKKEKRKAEEKEKKSPEAEPITEEQLTADDQALVVHGANEAANAVTAMFGELLRLDDEKEEPDASPPQLKPLDHMSNVQALATAFGVAEESFAPSYEDTGGYAYGDDYDGDGGYADYQARQEIQSSRGHEAQGSSTAAWAAKAGYGVQALVVSDAKSVKKVHPVFCQCAICQREEQKATAQDESLYNQEGHRGEQSMAFGQDNLRLSDRNVNHDTNSQIQGGYSGYKRHETYAGAGDSLDEEEYDEGPLKYQQNKGRQDYAYHQDDYDSYESVTYTVDEANRDTQATYVLPAHDTIQLGTGSDAGAPRRASDSVTSTQFSLDTKKILNPKKLRTGDKLSDGEFIVVHDGEYNRESVAIKKLTKKGVQSKEAIAEFTNEVEIMCSLSHENVMPCMAASITKPNYVFVTKMMKRGTLFNVLYKSRIKLTLALVRKISLQIANGMVHIHERGFIHRDLKSLNIFIDNSYNAKIGDFGLSRHISQSQGGGISGTYQYMAPEVLRGEPHSYKSDVFSFAILLNEMISAEPPFHGMDPRDVGQRVAHEDLRPDIPRFCQRSVAKIIEHCWASVPSMRPSFAQVVNLINTAF